MDRTRCDAERSDVLSYTARETIGDPTGIAIDRGQGDAGRFRSAVIVLRPLVR